MPLTGVRDETELIDRLRIGLKERYAVEREIGRGGMAVVYLARDLKLDRYVAAKVLRPEFAASLLAERFLREIQIAARLQHPMIIPLHDSGSTNGLLWYVMPYVEGETLRERLNKERQLQVDEALRIAREVSEALSYAHEQGVVHRDIKPENILLSGGHPLTTDFGVARAISEAGGQQLTSTGVALGTPAYMSPEQGSGDANVDGRSDIYSLGCVLYEMLAGEPPFTGPTARSVIAKHLTQQVPKLEVLRPGIAPQLAQVVETALAKVPADRYRTAAEFAGALDTASSGVFRRVRARRINRQVGVAGAVAIAGLVTLSLVLKPAAPSLDANKVVVFPLVERGPTGQGYDVSLMIGVALEHSEPLKWIDGWRYLDAESRANASLLSLAAARAITRDRRARYFLEGVVRSDRDSLAVILRLHDAAEDTLIGQETAIAAADVSAPYLLGLTAVRRLLPRLLDPGRAVDLASLSNRRPAAVALWIQGEREYRRSRFAEALDFYQRAVRQDSALAFAAVKGAQAANWLTNVPVARGLLGVALAHDTLLPHRYRNFARGLEAYLGGRADTAVSWLRRALVEDPQWAEALMVLGDVFYHLFPTDAPLDSLAEAAFEKALAADSSFTPPILHLVEIKVRRAELKRAGALLARLREAQPDTTMERWLSLMLDCVKQGSTKIDWGGAARSNLLALLYAAKGLSGGAAQPECAEAGFRAVMIHGDAPVGYRWAALLGLQGLLTAQRRTQELTALLDSMAAASMHQAQRLHVMGLYVIAAEAGLPVPAKTVEWESLARQRYGDKYLGAEPSVRWLLGVWYARAGDIGKLQQLHRDVAAQFTAGPDRRVRLLSDALTAHMALARGDTAAAIRVLRAVRPNAATGGDTLQWHPWESVPVERLTLARLLLARGEYEQAHRIATEFDHSAPIAYLAFVPASLAVRFEAARASGRSELAASYRERLAKLGRTDLVDSR